MTIVVPVAVSPPPLPQPDPTDRATFSTRKLSEMEWSRSTMIPGVKALADASYSNALDAQSNASISGGSAVVAAAAANFKGAWASQAGAMAKPASVFHNGAFWALLNNLGDVTASQPGVSADWVVAGGNFPIVSIAVDTVAVPWKTYVITAPLTLTLPAISGNGKQIAILILSGVAGVFVAPSGSDKIRSVAGVMTISGTPFSATITDTGAALGWV